MALNITKLTQNIHIYKSIFSLKKDKSSAIIICTGLNKFFPMHCILLEKILKRVLTYLHFPNIIKLNIPFNCTKTCFMHRVTQKISGMLWDILRKVGYVF